MLICDLCFDSLEQSIVAIVATSRGISEEGLNLGCLSEIAEHEELQSHAGVTKIKESCLFIYPFFFLIGVAAAQILPTETTQEIFVFGLFGHILFVEKSMCACVCVCV